MEPLTSAEKLLADSIASFAVSRDDVRSWVIQEQARGRRRATGFVCATSFCFLLLASGLLFSLNHQMQGIRELIDRKPTKALTYLTEIIEEHFDAPPADYFVRQRSHRKPIGRSLITSVAAR